MPHAQFDRTRLRFRPLAERPNKVAIEREWPAVRTLMPELSVAAQATVRETAESIRAARRSGRPVMLTFGAHTIKNCLGPLLIRFLEQGWVQHLATNGAGIIHDWEFAFQGQSSEDVRANVAVGQFGIWQETGLHLNLALVLGAFDGLGYGESVGRLIAEQGHRVPALAALSEAVAAAGAGPEAAESAAAAADVMAVVARLGLAAGPLPVPHAWQRFSVQAAAYRLGVPCTGHPMFGHDIIYTHPANHGAAIGRTAQRDFLSFAQQVSRLDGGVYLSVGSAVMSPMVFEKSVSMAQNLSLQAGRRLENHFMVVVDLAESRWDWSKGEPPADSPDYYLRHCKSFSRMGGTMRYVAADNRHFLVALARELGVL